MATSATAAYSAVQVGGAYNYLVRVTNTSPAPFDIYGILLNESNLGSGHYDTSQLNYVVFIGFPPGWTGNTFATGGWTGPASADGIALGTNWQGDPHTSGYIMPGQTADFRFQSSSAPNSTLPFTCWYFNGQNEWGFAFYGTAHRVEHIPKPPRPPMRRNHNIINPLVLVLGDDAFIRLNLPRPAANIDAGLLESLATGIRSMTRAQRATAANSVGAYIAALAEVRAALEATDEAGPSAE